MQGNRALSSGCLEEEQENNGSQRLACRLDFDQADLGAKTASVSECCSGVLRDGLSVESYTLNGKWMGGIPDFNGAIHSLLEDGAYITVGNRNESSRW